MKSRIPTLTLLSAVVLMAAASLRSWQPPFQAKALAKANRRPVPSGIAGSYGNLPLSFEANDGQADPGTEFLVHGQGYTLLLRQGEAVLAFPKLVSGGESRSVRQARGATNQPVSANPALRLALLGADSHAKIAGEDELSGKVNYLVGSDPAAWHTNVPTYSRVEYSGVYPGVDLAYYGREGRLEYDFILHPGADPNRIRLGVAGSGLRAPQAAIEPRLRISPDGDLVVSLGAGDVRLEKPVIYQQSDDKRRLIQGRFRLIDGHTVGFELGRYDRSLPLVIDPMLVYSSYLGGTGSDAASGIAVDSTGSAYLTGSTQSANFPTASTTPLQAKLGGASNVFVSKFNTTGTALVYSTYLGGAGSDQGSAIAVDSSGSAYVAGSTTSQNFPTTTGAFQTKYGGNGDAFVAKLSADGSKLVYSTYLGGSDADFGHGIAVDKSGNAYVAGQTSSTAFPTQSPFQSSCNVPTGGTCSDAFVSELNAMGSGLTYSTYLGGSGSDSAQAIAVDASGAAYVAGFTLSVDFPTLNPIQKSAGGAGDAFAAKLAPGGSKLSYSTYLGGSGLDRAFGLAVDAGGNAYVTGDTASANFPVTAGALDTLAPGNGDAFVAKLNPAGTALVYSTYLGGGALDQGLAIAVDASGGVAVTGLTQSSDFPTVTPFSPALSSGTCGTNVCSDAFVARLSASGSSLVYSSYLGGSGTDTGQAIALDTSGNAYVAGSTASSNFPAVAGAFQGAYGASGSLTEAFIAKVAPADAAVLAATPQSLTFGNQGVNSTGASITVTLSDAGSAPLTLSSFTASSGFAVAPGGSCAAGTVLQPGTACTVHVAFTPTAEAAATGTLTVTDSAAGSPHRISLAGTGVAATPAVTLSATGLTFPATVVGSASAPQTVTLTNSGSASLSITAVSVSGNYTETNNCGTSVNAGAACQVALVFRPLQTGADTGTLTISDSATGSPHTVSLTGTGTAVFSLAVTVPPPTVVIGTTSTTLTVKALALRSFTSQITIACGTGATCTSSPATIAPGQTSTVTLSGLSGTTPNPFTFTVTGTINSGASTQQVSSTSVTLNFADVSISAAPPVSSIVAGHAATYIVIVTPLNGFKQSVALSCAQTLQAATCSISPTSLTLNGTRPASATVTVQTSQQSVRAFPRRMPGPPPRTLPLPTLGLALAALAVLGCVSAVRHGTIGPAGQRWAIVALALVMVAAWSACNNYGYNVVGTGGVTGTQSGNYTVRLSATIGAASSTTSVVRSTTVNLSVASSL